MTMPITDPAQIAWYINQMDTTALHNYLQQAFPAWGIR